MQIQPINGTRWAYWFIRGDPKLSEADKYTVLLEAVSMFFEGRDEESVKTETLVGRVYTKNTFAMIGQFGGIEYKAELYSDDRRIDISFLISEQTQGPNSRASRN